MSIGVKVCLHPRNNWLKDNGYSLSEEEDLYDDLLVDVYRNPRWYLDNAYKLPTFRVRWHYYKGVTPVLPYSVVKIRKGL